MSQRERIRLPGAGPSRRSRRMADRLADRRTIFLVHRGEPETLTTLGLWVVTAASTGERVEVLLGAAPLRAIVAGAGRSDRAKALGLPDVRELFAQAKALAPMRVVTCDTELALAELTADQVAAF